jgi:valyl-tRNA synthetase
VRLPLTKREIPVIADATSTRDFGTGVVKVTPAHDFNDYAVGQRHGLPMINIFTPEAKIDHSIATSRPTKYRGLDRYVARKHAGRPGRRSACWSRKSRTSCRCRAATAPAR